MSLSKDIFFTNRSQKLQNGPKHVLVFTCWMKILPLTAQSKINVPTLKTFQSMEFLIDL